MFVLLFWRGPGCRCAVYLAQRKVRTPEKSPVGCEAGEGRAPGQLTAGRRDPTESATENIPPVHAQVRVKWWGKGPPLRRQRRRHGKPPGEQDQIDRRAPARGQKTGPVVPAGRSLEVAGDRHPRGMAPSHRIRLIGPPRGPERGPGLCCACGPAALGKAKGCGLRMRPAAAPSPPTATAAETAHTKRADCKTSPVRVSLPMCSNARHHETRDSTRSRR